MRSFSSVATLVCALLAGRAAAFSSSSKPRLERSSVPVCAASSDDEQLEVYDVDGVSVAEAAAPVSTGEARLRRRIWNVITRARTTEAELGKTRGELDSLRADQATFLREREAEVELVESATGEAMKLKRRMGELEEELRQSERVVASSEKSSARRREVAGAELAKTQKALKEVEAARDSILEVAEMARKKLEASEAAAKEAEDGRAAQAAEVARERELRAAAESRFVEAEDAKKAALDATAEAETRSEEAESARLAALSGEKAATGRATKAEAASLDAAQKAQAAEQRTKTAKRDNDGFQRVMKRMADDYQLNLDSFKDAATKAQAEAERATELATSVFAGAYAAQQDAKRADEARVRAEEATARAEGERERAVILQRVTDGKLRDATAKYESVANERNQWRETATLYEAELEKAPSLLRRLWGLAKRGAFSQVNKVKAKTRTIASTAKDKVTTPIKRLTNRQNDDDNTDQQQ